MDTTTTEEYASAWALEAYSRSKKQGEALEGKADKSSLRKVYSLVKRMATNLVTVNKRLSALEAEVQALKEARA